MNTVKLVKKSFVTCLAIIVTIALTPILTAQADSNSSYGDIELVKGELTIGDIAVRDASDEELAKMESGEIDALKFETKEDFEEYLEQIEAKTVDITDKITEIPTFSTFGLSDISSRVIGVDPIPMPPVYINCQFTYASKKDTSGQWAFTSITDIKSWLTGIQFPIRYTWEQKAGTYTFANSKRNVTITTSGVLGTHLIVEGIGQILEYNMTYSFDYMARQ